MTLEERNDAAEFREAETVSTARAASPPTAEDALSFAHMIVAIRSLVDVPYEDLAEQEGLSVEDVDAIFQRAVQLDRW